MLNTRRRYYYLIIAILEKHGYEVTTCRDFKTMYVHKNPNDNKTIIFTDLEKIFFHEDIDDFIADIEPIHIAAWKIKTI